MDFIDESSDHTVQAERANHMQCYCTIANPIESVAAHTYADLDEVDSFTHREREQNSEHIIINMQCRQQQATPNRNSNMALNLTNEGETLSVLSKWENEWAHLQKKKKKKIHRVKH